MEKVNRLLKPITNLLQRILHYYNYRALNMTYGSVLFIKERSYFDIVCPLKNEELKVVEIGVFEGRNSKDMMKLLDINKLYLIDPYTEIKNTREKKDNYMNNPNWNNIEKKARKKMLRFGKKVVFIKKFSEDAVDDIPDNMDYIYIDGSHDYRDVKLDIENYYKKVRVGGILAGHDIILPDVLKAVLEFTNKNNLKFIISNHDWIIIKQKGGRNSSQA